ncbi:MAG: hypothetical protein ACRDD7_01035 [Peptostreptococcaceae bacterium]
MRKCGRKSCGCKQNKSCGCMQPKPQPKPQPCGCNNGLNECTQFKQCANEKCTQAEMINNKANKIAQQAIAAEQRAEALKQQAIEECKRANELWEEYNRLAEQGVCLMKQAEAFLAKSVECYENLYEDVEGCDLDCFGYNKCRPEPCRPEPCRPEPPCGGCNCGCGCR